MFSSGKALKWALLAGLAWGGGLQAASLAGQVTNAVTGDPVVEAQIRFLGNPVDPAVMTDENGNYVIQNLEPGTVAPLFAIHPAYQEYVDQAVQVGEGETAYSFQMQPQNGGGTGTIQGYAYDEGGSGIPGVQILQPTGPTDDLHFTDESGFYSFEVFTGTQSFLAVAEGYAEYFDPFLTLEAGVNSYDFVMQTGGGDPEAASLGGVTLDAESGNLLGGVQVSIGRGPFEFWSTVSGEDGGFFIDSLQSGPVFIQAEKEGYQPLFMDYLLEPGENFVSLALSDGIGNGDADLEGLVVHGDMGMPVPGAFVSITRDFGIPHFTETSEDGSFQFLGVESGLWSLAVEAFGFQTVVTDVDLQQGENGITIQLEDAANGSTLAGQVTDAETGIPLAGVEIHVPMSPADPIFYTDESGHYFISGLFPGPGELFASHPGYYEFALDLMLEEGDNSLDFQLQPIGNGGEFSVVEGLVYNVEDQSPVPGAEIHLMSNSGIVYSASTGEAGTFALDVETGVYQLVAWSAGFSEYTSVLQVFEPQVFVEIGLVTEGEEVLADLGGQVTDAETGLGVPEAMVFLPGMRPVDPPVFTDEQGFYEVTGLLAGPSFVNVDHPAYFPFDSEIFLAEGGNTLDIVLQPLSGNGGGNALLFGAVTDSLTGEGISGVDLFLPGANGDMRHVQSGPQGQYEVAGLLAGPTQLTAQAPGYYAHFEQLVLQEGENEFNFSMAQRDGEEGDLIVMGTVVDNITRQPVPEAVVLLMGGADFNATVTGQDGSFEFPPLLEYNLYLELMVEAEGYLPEVVQLMAGQGDSLEVEVFLTPQDGGMLMGMLSGAVTTEQGGLPAFALIEAFNPNAGNPISYSTWTSPSGGWSLEVPEGQYAVSVRVLYDGNGNGMEYMEFFDNVTSLEDATLIDVMPGDVIESIDFEVPRQDPDPIVVNVSGRVTNSSGEGVPGATVRFWTQQGELDTFTLTDDEGYWDATLVLDRLPIVPFTVSSEHELFDMEFFSDSPSFETATQFSFSDDASITNMNFSLDEASDALSTIGGEIQDPEGNPLGSGLVAVFDPDGTGVRTVAAANGQYSVGNPFDEDVVLMYLAPGYAPSFSGGVHSLDNAQSVDAMTDHAGLDVQLHPLSGQAGNHVLLGSVINQGGGPVGGALVLAVSQDGNLAHYTFSTSTGQYSLGGLSANTGYNVYFSRAGYHSETLVLQTNPIHNLTQNAVIQLETRGETSIEPALPAALSLEPNYPNPFNPSTLIPYELPEAGMVRLTVFDLRGALVATLVDGEQAAGRYEALFQASNLASGVYIARLETPRGQLHRKMLLVK